MFANFSTKTTTCTCTYLNNFYITIEHFKHCYNIQFSVVTLHLHKRYQMKTKVNVICSQYTTSRHGREKREKNKIFGTKNNPQESYELLQQQ